jgi:hypothetical protein
LGEDFRQGRITNIQPDVVRVSHDITGSPQEVWVALAQAYADLGIQDAVRDPRNLSITNPDLRVTRRLGGERLSRFLSCGSGFTGAFADSYRIQMNIHSQVRQGPEGRSTLDTIIQAFGTNRDGTSNTRVSCASRHVLEARLAQAVERILRDPGCR